MSESRTPTLVFLHGFLGSSHEWDVVAKQLAQDYPVLCPDLPGHGLPAANLPDQVDFDSINQWLITYLKQHEVTHYILIGYSLGGRIALHHAVQTAELDDHDSGELVGLILEGANPGLCDAKSRQERLASDIDWSRKLARKPITHVVKEWYQQPMFADLDDAQRKQLIRERGKAWGNSLATVITGLSLGKQQDFREWLTKTQLPIHYIHGEKDSKFADICSEIKQLNSKIVEHSIYGAGHNTHRADPVHFVQTLNNAIQSIENDND
ncbi:2-succinyl-6-hydroxy-2,4-cyclohexadiene-1-carboxylate synthase [Corallincola platygyrae]|uniref:Putative 2-succinyl-6-hydroxy-2,4-cyclohexadiene-1-carboxylate synthase n=1 Tax=Corallincola platygyrae TaxID=1193278 RepID=A0ABW4XMQ6_9GAMM